jgi:predicted peptidase
LSCLGEWKPRISTWKAFKIQRRRTKAAPIGVSALPLVVFLHGAGNDENSYVDQNNQQMAKLADQHGFVLVSALGYGGAFGTMIRLPAVFGQPEEAAKMLAGITSERRAAEAISERDVINVIELVRGEYPINDKAMFLTGHSMGSGGTWYIGGKYSSYWAGLAPMSGPFAGARLPLGKPKHHAAAGDRRHRRHALVGRQSGVA